MTAADTSGAHGSAGESGPLDSLRRATKIGGSRVCIWGPGLLLAGFLVWAAFAHLDEVAVATGEVIPQQQLQVVQHLEGGVIERILVGEGDIVETGQILMQLNLGGAGINREELQVRLDGARLARARLIAESEGGDSPPAFPPELAEERPGMVAAELRKYDARRRDLDASLAVLDERAVQRGLEISELEAQLASIRRDLSLAQQRLSMSADLLEDGLTPRMEHVEIEAEVEKLFGQVSVLEQSIPRARAALSEIRAQRARELESYGRRALEELVPIEARIAELRETLETATDQQLRAEIRSPIDGTVKNMKTNTVGGVIRPGEPIAEIVPASDDLEIRARLNPRDRGFVTAGQRAIVKITTYDFARYGGLEGRVERVSASTNTDQQGGAYYEVVVRTDRNYLGERDGDFPITPGMEASVDIHTGTRTVLDYLVKPVLKLQHEAFRER